VKARAAYAFAFLSGAAALVYEVTWAKMLALSFGSTTLSAAAVVTAFLGGMGIGAALYGRLPGHAERPLRWYARIELAIGLSAAVLSSTFYALPEALRGLASASGPPWVEMVLKWTLVFALLLVPAALMGATFPALCRALIRSSAGADRHLGWIYGVNTLGAAAGALLAGLVLAERLGLRGASLAANAVNLAVAFGAWRLSRSEGAEGEASPDPMVTESIPTRLPRAATAVVLVLSGCATLGYEISWFRGLRYLVGASNYAFSIVLFTFLCGLGLGSLALERLLRRGRPERDLARVQVLAAVLALLGIGLQAYVLTEPALYRHLSVFVPEVRQSPWTQRIVLDVVVAVATLLPATVVMGMSFPLATRLFLGDVRHVDARAGTAYLLANVGSIAGGIGGALLLLPAFGVVGGTRVCAVLNLTAAAVVALAMPGSRAGLAATVAAGGALVAGAGLVLPRSLPLLGERITGGTATEVAFLEEGDLATVQVLREPGRADRLAMAIDGYKIGWSEAYRETAFYQKQMLLADLPQVLDSRARTTLSIGLGSGATIAELCERADLARIDCVEINGAVVRGQKLFPERRVLADPRVRLFVEDAVHFLLREGETYDLVVSDGKQDPFFAGNADLLCEEFYRFARRRLREHGFVVQWFPLATLPQDLRVILATLCRSFPEVDAFVFPPGSILLVAGSEPLFDRPPMTEEAFAASPIARTLGAYGLDSVAAVRSHWTAGRGALAAAVEGEPSSRWNRQILDVSAFKAHGSEWADASRTNLALLCAVGEHEPAPKGLDARRFEAARLLRKSFLALQEQRRAEAIELADRAAATCAESSEARNAARLLRELPGGP
jgi:spermidine synthase